MIVFLILHEGSVFLFFSEWGPVNEIEGDEYLHKIFKIFLNQKKNYNNLHSIVNKANLSIICHPIKYETKSKIKKKTPKLIKESQMEVQYRS